MDLITILNYASASAINSSDLAGELVSEYGLLGVVTVGIVYVFKQIWNKQLATALRKVILTKIASSMLSIDAHPLLYCNNRFRRILSGADMGDGVRDEIFKIIFTEYLDQMVKWADDAIKSGKWNDSTAAKLQSMLSERLDEFEVNAKRAIIKRYRKIDTDGHAIWNIVYEKKVKTYNSSTIDIIFGIIEAHETTKLPVGTRLYAIFNAVHSMLDVTILNIEKTFRNLNGELSSITDKYKYDGSITDKPIKG